MQIRYLDMFAGVGGFRTGLTNAGDIFVPENEIIKLEEINDAESCY